MTTADRYPRYRAPRGDQQVLCVPPWPALPQTLTDARQILGESRVEISGRPLAELASQAQQELVSQAQHYTNSYLDSAVTVNENSPLVVTGHQPELVHAGVWLKNFAASQLASQVGGAAISLVIDNDLCRSSSTRVPTDTVKQPRVVDVPFDHTLPEMPYEERGIADRATWDSFGQRATQILASLVSDPLLVEWWPEVLKLSECNSNVGSAIAQARHRTEHRWGNRTLEVPLSLICDTPSFRLFLIHLLTNAAKLREHYNESLGEYREVHRLRSAAQPLPDLIEVDGWIETPFWVWTQDDLARRALFVKPNANGLLLSDRQHWQQTLPSSEQDALASLQVWREQGVKLRTRALITTLYTRLLIADTFIHGIGGAKYDQVTNALCKRFFDTELPSYIALSGTLYLPIGQKVVIAAPPNHLLQTLRNMRYHPETFLDIEKLKDRNVGDEELSQVQTRIQQKKHAITTPKTKENAAQRHAEIASANNALQPWLAAERQQLELELSTAIIQTRANQLLESREYAFCLFPQGVLQDFFLDFSRQMP